MPTCTLHLNQNKQLDGISERDQKVFAKFKYLTKNLGDASITFSWAVPRSGPFHRRFFAQLNAIFESQDRFDDFDKFRVWAEVGSGHVEFYPHSTGQIIALPKSISYGSLDQQEFSAVSDSIFNFLKSSHATRYLWPHLLDAAGTEMIETILRQFES